MKSARRLPAEGGVQAAVGLRVGDTELGMGPESGGSLPPTPPRKGIELARMSGTLRLEGPMAEKEGESLQCHLQSIKGI